MKSVFSDEGDLKSLPEGTGEIPEFPTMKTHVRDESLNSKDKGQCHYGNVYDPRNICQFEVKAKISDWGKK